MSCTSNEFFQDPLYLVILDRYLRKELYMTI